MTRIQTTRTHRPQTLSPSRCFGLAIAMGLTLCLGAAAQAATTTLTLIVTDGADGQALVEQKVYGYEVKPNGSILSIPGSPFFSDTDGRIELDGLETHGTYYFKTVTAFQRWQRTEHVTPTMDTLAFRVGYQTGITGGGVSVDADTPSAFTDAALERQAGVAEPEVAPQPNEGVAPAFIFTDARAEPSNLESILSLEVPSVVLTNALSGDPIAGVKVYAYQVNPGGANERADGWPKTTDANGEVDALDLFSSNTYYLKARVYNRKWTRTDNFQPSGGDIDFAIGSLEIAVVDASQHIPGDPVPNQRVNIQEHLGNRQFQTIQSIRSDNDGIIRTDVPGLGVNVEVRIEIDGAAPSPITIGGDNVTSDLIVARGNYAFAVDGELPQEPPANHVALQTINRATFGMTTDLLSQVDGLTHEQAVAWADAWLLEQLEYPAGIAAPTDIVIRDQIQGADRTLPFYPYPGSSKNDGSLGTLVPFTANPDMSAFQARVDSFPTWREINTTGVLVPNGFELDRIPLIYMIESPWQLREVMAQFWDNHFSTELSASGNWRLTEHNETLGFRVDRVITDGRPDAETPEENAAIQIQYTNLNGDTKMLSSSGALGNFPSLLYFSATNPSMIVYLNSADNVKGDPNENYAREVFELHCMGVDNGYSLDDIKEASRVFTGWHRSSGPKTKPGITGFSAQNSKFNFNPGQHSNGVGEFDESGNPITDPNKNTIIRLNADYNPGTDPPEDFFVYGPIEYRSGDNGVQEGLELLDRLTRIRETSLFIAGKLVEVFVSDEPLPDLQSRIADVMEANVDHPEQIKVVVYSILTSPEFRAVENFRTKYKTPLEDTTGLHRQLMPNVNDLWILKPNGTPGGNANGSNGEYGAPRNFLDNASMGLYAKVEPTGYPENGAEWLDTDGLLKRLNHHYDVAFNNKIGLWTLPNPNPNNLEDSTGLRAFRWMSEIKGFTTKGEVIDYCLALLTNGYVTQVERTLYEQALDFHQAFNLVNPASQSRQDDNIRLLIAYITTSPQYLYQ